MNINKTTVRTKVLALALAALLLLGVMPMLAFASETTDITIRGYQQTVVSNEKYSVRFIASGIETDEIDAVGFEISVDGKSIDKQSTTVYKALSANYGKETLTAESLGAEYLIGMAITDIPTSKGELEFAVTPYTVKNGSKVYGVTKNVTVTPNTEFVVVPEGDGMVVDWNSEKFEHFETVCYIDGVKQSEMPEAGEYVAYISSSATEDKPVWNYSAWSVSNSAADCEIYFTTVSELYDSVADMKASASSYSVGDLVGTKSYYAGESRGAAVYKIASSSSTGSVSLGSGKYATIVPFEIGSDKIITVDMLGAYADGETDDASVINSAINFSDCTVVEFEGDDYIQSNYIYLSKSNVTINGYGAKISNKYTKFNYWVDFQISASDVTLKNLTIYCSESNTEYLYSNSSHAQLLIRSAENVVIDGVSVICPLDEDVSDRNVTSIWANTDVNNITIQNCTVKNFSQSGVGGGIWVSAGTGYSSANINILNNHIEKSSHDEVLAFFIGDFDGILVEGNYIYTHDEPIGNPSKHAIGFGVSDCETYIENAVFKNNTVDVVAEYDIFTFYSVNGLDIYDNELILRNNTVGNQYDSLYKGIFRVADGIVGTATLTDVNIYNNDIKIYNTSTATMEALASNMGSGCAIYNNTFYVDSKMSNIIYGDAPEFYDNTITFNQTINSYSDYSSTNTIIIN